MNQFRLRQKINFCLRLYGLSAILWSLILGLIFFVKYLSMSEFELSHVFGGPGLEWFFGCVIALLIAIPYFVLATFVFSIFNIGTNVISSGIKSVFLSLFALIVSILIVIVSNMFNAAISDKVFLVLSIILPPLALYTYFFMSSKIIKKRAKQNFQNHSDL